MPAKKPEPTFEEALVQLEALVNSMESGEIPLDTLVEKFEEGSKLVKQCETRLKQAELKVQKLREEGGKAVLEPLPADQF